jgi:hypothetical protein
MSEVKSEEMPQAFVHWAKIKELLAQANTHGVTTTLLMQARTCNSLLLLWWCMSAEVTVRAGIMYMCVRAMCICMHVWCE